MLDLLKRTALAGVGLAFMTKEKLEELSRELAQKAKLSEEEGRQFMEDLRQKSSEARRNMEEKVADMVRCSLAKMDIATKADVEELRKRIEELQSQLGKTAE